MFKAVAIPQLLLKGTILVLIIRFELYLLFQLIKDIKDQLTINYNVFFIFIISISIFVLYYLYIINNLVNN